MPFPAATLYPSNLTLPGFDPEPARVAVLQQPAIRTDITNGATVPVKLTDARVARAAASDQRSTPLALTDRPAIATTILATPLTAVKITEGTA
jgi:hypothetical protein